MRFPNPVIWLASIPVVATVAIFVAVLLSGCATDWQAMDCPEVVDPVLVAWLRSQDAGQVCRLLGMPDGTIACTEVTRTWPQISNAKIYSKPDVEDRFLGHEFRHAYGCTHRG